jgi:hypothetical protein
MATWLHGASAPRSKQNLLVPLDAFQRDVLAVLSRRRTPSSPLAGGAVLQLHGYPPGELRNSVFAADEGALPGMISEVRTALDEAEQIVGGLPRDTVGKVLADDAGRSVRSLDDIKTAGQRTIAAAPGGTWPSGPDIDHFVIERMIERYGHNGEKLWAAEPMQPAADL